MTCGIYLLKFNNTNKVYVGLSTNIEKRYSQHIQSMKTLTSSDKLNKAYIEYGKPYLEILVECEKEELDVNEKEAIEIFNSIIDGFNSTTGGSIGHQHIGDRNGKSVFSNKLVEQAFLLLTQNNYLTYKEISSISGVSKAVITNIKNGVSHLWLKELYPLEYNNMLNIDRHKEANSISAVKRTISSKLGYTPKVIKDNIVYSITSLADFCKEFSLTGSAMSSVINGKASHHKGWRIYNGSTS